MADEALRILKQCSVASIGIEGHLRVLQMLKHEVRVAVGKHGVVAAADDQNRLTDGSKNPVARIFRAHQPMIALTCWPMIAWPLSGSLSAVRALARLRKATPAA